MASKSNTSISSDRKEPVPHVDENDLEGTDAYSLNYNGRPFTGIAYTRQEETGGIDSETSYVDGGRPVFAAPGISPELRATKE